MSFTMIYKTNISMNIKLQLLILSVFSGILLWLSWVPSGFPFLLFFAFIPLFFIGEIIVENNFHFPFWKGICYAFPAFLIWNVATTWWVWNSTPPGSVAAFLLNAFLMSIVFGLWLFYQNSKFKIIPHSVVFIALWLSFEYLHLNWDLNWPWLNLGNAFANATQYVQWYSVTGSLGGTLWVLAINFLLFYLIKSIKQNKKWMIRYAIITAAVVLIPIISSVVVYSQYDIKKENGIEAVVVQQNTDPWNEQYAMSNTQHVERLLSVALPYIDSNTKLMVCAESAIPHTVTENELIAKSYNPRRVNYHGFVMFDSITSLFPQLSIVSGLSTAKIYSHKATVTAREMSGNQYYDLFNTSMCYSNNGKCQFYHKSHLVPGVEKMPFPKVLGFLEHLVIDLGGPSGSLGTDVEGIPFTISDNANSFKLGVPICYESVFGKVFAEFVQNGATVMAVITNDSWWKNTAGHKQHFLYAKLRAVESRRYILRAANTGTSAIIDPKGDVVQSTNYMERIAIKGTVYPNDKITFYVKAGDYLAIIAVFVTFSVFFWVIVLGIVKRINNRKSIKQIQ